MLDLEKPNSRGRPLTPVQQVCLALNYYGGGHFNRVAALCGGVSQSAAWHAIKRVTNQLADLVGVYIQMPSNEEMAATARRMEDRFHLEGFALGVDGVVVKFQEAPRGIPPGTVKRDFWNRKMCHAFNVQVVGTDSGQMCNVNAGFFGSANDSRIWADSLVKEAIESQNQFLVAGDSGYPISQHLITPYRSAEAMADASKRLFNKRLSGLRTVMTENIFGVWKRRFPCLNNLRCHVDLARKVVYATAVLHNLAIRWADEEVEEDLDDGGVDNDEPADPAGDAAEDDAGPVGNDAGPALVRARGQTKRDWLRMRMPPGRE
jgi:hypothetical protein